MLRNDFTSQDSIDSISYLNSDEIVKIVDLNQSLGWEYRYIECRHSFSYKDLYPLFCVNDPQSDQISFLLWTDNFYENNVIGD